ncbi:MAG: UbiA family prenyltransferase [Myxococcaceae bacterium]|nr:UbiA family prenyltransferase [Myxococcaceae bacterium]MCI0673456.1 UbiA family prenyltransferase [Myxococcaceae bacterium]
MSQPDAGLAEPRRALTLVVGLDGTLVHTDTHYEALLVLLKRAPWLVLLVPLWLLKGRAHLKAEISRRVELDAAYLPYNAELLAYLRAEGARGRRLVLATSADQRIANAVAEHLALFSEVHASDGRTHLSGARKLARLKECLGTSFAYAGNRGEDLLVWKDAHEALLVGAARGVQRRCAALGRPVRTFDGPRAGWQAWLKALRMHQWAKNLLVFVPLLAAHRGLELGLVGRAFLGFIAFCFCASSVYLLNDLLDLPSDRRHPTKRLRPFASGTLPLEAGLVLAPLLAGAGAALTLLLPPAFGAALGAYYAITLAYSFHLKQVAVLDVLVLAGLYTVRILAGALAVGVPTSSWLLSFAMFLFLSLALVKRVSEVRRLRLASQDVVHGRGYGGGDYEVLVSLGTAAGYVAAVVLSLYINSDTVSRLYVHPERLWLLCPVLLYWVSRIWLLAHRGKVDEDPLVFAMRDPVSFGMGVLAASILYSAA